MSSSLPRRQIRLLSSSNPRDARRAPTSAPALAALALAATVATLGLSGCPGSLDPSLLATGTAGSGGGGGSSAVCDAPAMVFQSTDTLKGCGAENGCHGAVAKESGLDLVSPGVISRLLDKAPDPTMSLECMASTEAYLKSGTTPAQGLLLDKLNTGSCGQPMPYPLGGLPQQQRDCITQWANAVTSGMITQ